MKPPASGTVRRFSPLFPVLLAGVLAVACGPNRGPDYGADPVESQSLAIPPDLTAEPLATQNPFPDLPDIERPRTGPDSAEAEGDWMASLDGNTLNVPVPEAWAMGSVRAALLLHGIAVAEERLGLLRTGWLSGEDHRHLGVEPPSQGRVRYTLESRPQANGATRILAQAESREGDEVKRASQESVTQFLQAIQPAFGKRR
ncbi:hypothetical protein [Thiohalorhabdus sp.]|uniref:hypothetical protein n=1 Tax=Thiohalorhabdus sp. TaxID=3094134 RepID=UPI002FC3B3E4